MSEIPVLVFHYALDADEIKRLYEHDRALIELGRKKGIKEMVDWAIQTILDQNAYVLTDLAEWQAKL